MIYLIAYAIGLIIIGALALYILRELKVQEPLNRIFQMVILVLIVLGIIWIILKAAGMFSI